MHAVLACLERGLCQPVHVVFDELSLCFQACRRAKRVCSAAVAVVAWAGAPSWAEGRASLEASCWAAPLPMVAATMAATTVEVTLKDGTVHTAGIECVGSSVTVEAAAGCRPFLMQPCIQGSDAVCWTELTVMVSMPTPYHLV
jgi:hypothetical protein